jgi:lysophospholipase L1-like esterase
MKASANRARLVILPTILAALALLALAEAAVRLVLYTRTNDRMYLLTPWFGSAPSIPSVGSHTLTRVDPCSRRSVSYSVNAEGGRGAEWPTARIPGRVRILALGASPEGASWPTAVETALSATGRAVEVHNGGAGGANLEYFLERLEGWLPKLRPDIVLYHGGHNDANPDSLTVAALLDDTVVGRSTRFLYYRSMLYTYVAEKIHFATQMRGQYGLVPDVVAFGQRVDRYVRIAREHGAIPVVVLQATELPPESQIAPAVSHTEDDRKAVILRLAAAGGASERERVRRMRAYKTQMLVETLRIRAFTQEVPVIDARPAFAAARAEAFCDEIHLTARGNDLLAHAIAAGLEPVLQRLR